jgi:hypothetical protein
VRPSLASIQKGRKHHLPLRPRQQECASFFSLRSDCDSLSTLFIRVLTRGNNAIHYKDEKSRRNPGLHLHHVAFEIYNGGCTRSGCALKIRQKIIAFVLIHAFPCSTSRAADRCLYRKETLMDVLSCDTVFPLKCRGKRCSLSPLFFPSPLITQLCNVNLFTGVNRKQQHLSGGEAEAGVAVHRQQSAIHPLQRTSTDRLHACGTVRVLLGT